MHNISGCGLGLRLEFIDEVYNYEKSALPAWFEIAPENWMATNKKTSAKLEQISNDFALVAHGLSLSIGSIEPLNIKFIKSLKEFLDRFNILHYSEHLSFSSLGGAQSYELLPVPLTKNMAQIIADKANKLQDILERDVILENPTFYHMPYAEISEIDFINLLLEKSDAKLLLDVNNVYVNAHNHKFCAKEFLSNIALDRVSYIHIAGHAERYDGVWIDTHGMPVKDEVFNLLEFVLSKKTLPVLLERDNNIPPLNELLTELDKCKAIYNKCLKC